MFTIFALIFVALMIIAPYAGWDASDFVAPAWICIATSAILQRLEVGHAIHVYLSADRGVE